MSEQRSDNSGRATCPTCKARVPRDAKSYPFCSDRCRTIDLAKWLDGDYVISRPIEEADLDQGE